MTTDTFPIGVVTMLFLLAFLIETLVEAIFGIVFDKNPKLTPYKWTLMYVAMVVGIVGAFAYNFNVVYIIGGYLGTELPASPLSSYFGIVITGLAIGRGSNYIHDLVANILRGRKELTGDG